MKNRNILKFEYDEESDGAYIWFSDDNESKRNYVGDIWVKGFKEEIGFLFDKDDKIIAIEIQPASKYLRSSLLKN